jgi:predicted DCC family thiol-disulfide oxidoreductase YuxK
VKKSDSHNAIILFDGVCNFCNSSINFVIRHDKKKYFKFATLQSSFAKELLQELETLAPPMDSLVLIENNKLFKRSTAVLNIAKKLDGAYFFLSVFFILPRFIRDHVYFFVAKKRYKWFGKKEACMIPTEEVKERFIS